MSISKIIFSLVGRACSSLRKKKSICRRTEIVHLFFAAKTGRPIAYATDWIIAQSFRTSVFPSYDTASFHFRAGNEFSTRQRMRKIALVQTLDDAAIV